MNAKTIVLALAKAISIVVASYGAVIAMAFAIEEWVIKKAEAVVDQKIEVVKEIRKADIEHLDKRFDRIEKLIERK